MMIFHNVRTTSFCYYPVFLGDAPHQVPGSIIVSKIELISIEKGELPFFYSPGFQLMMALRLRWSLRVAGKRMRIKGQFVANHLRKYCIVFKCGPSLPAKGNPRKIIIRVGISMLCHDLNLAKSVGRLKGWPGLFFQTFLCFVNQRIQLEDGILNFKWQTISNLSLFHGLLKLSKEIVRFPLLKLMI